MPALVLCVNSFGSKNIVLLMKGSKCYLSAHHTPAPPHLFPHPYPTQPSSCPISTPAPPHPVPSLPCTMPAPRCTHRVSAWRRSSSSSSLSLSISPCASLSRSNARSRSYKYTKQLVQMSLTDDCNTMRFSQSVRHCLFRGMHLHPTPNASLALRSRVFKGLKDLLHVSTLPQHWILLVRTKLSASCSKLLSFLLQSGLQVPCCALRLSQLNSCSWSSTSPPLPPAVGPACRFIQQQALLPPYLLQ